MTSLQKTFKEDGLSSFIDEVEKRIESNNNQLKEINKKLEYLELLQEFNSSIFVQTGAVIEPVSLIGKFLWKAEDLSDYINGLEVVTLDNGQATRWASDKVNNIKITLPLLRDKSKSLKIIFNGSMNSSVLQSLKITIDAKKNAINLIKNTNGYEYTGIITEGYKGKNTIIVLEFTDKIEEKTRHTLGINSLEIV
jgi:hypothetical protein